jgi:hypothetical protein
MVSLRFRTLGDSHKITALPDKEPHCHVRFSGLLRITDWQRTPLPGGVGIRRGVPTLQKP